MSVVDNFFFILKKKRSKKKPQKRFLSRHMVHQNYMPQVVTQTHLVLFPVLFLTFS